MIMVKTVVWAGPAASLPPARPRPSRPRPASLEAPPPSTPAPLSPAPRHSRLLAGHRDLQPGSHPVEWPLESRSLSSPSPLRTEALSWQRLIACSLLDFRICGSWRAIHSFIGPVNIERLDEPDGSVSDII